MQTAAQPMVKANELRIGNLVYRTGMMGGVKWYQEIKVQSICSEGIEVKYAGWGGEDPEHIKPQYEEQELEPIPLTPPLLEKYGFVENERRKGEWNKGDFEIDKEGDGFAVFASEWTIGKPFKHLHQLQNLYFALTGEELKIGL